MTPDTPNGVERRLRLVEMKVASLESDANAKQKTMDEGFERNDRDHAVLHNNMNRIQSDVHQVQRSLDKMSVRVGMMVVGASVIVTIILSLIHYASR